VWTTVTKALDAGKPVLTFDDPANRRLLAEGALPLVIPDVPLLLASVVRADIG